MTISEYDEGWEQGVRDAYADMLPRFRQQHSEYAKGYLAGYVCAVDFMTKGIG